jgi:hypothetical protein
MILYQRCKFCVSLCLVAVLFLFASIASGQDSSRSSGWIAIPAADYQSLHSKAYPVEPIPEPPPLQSTLTRINYDLQISGDLAVGQATLVVDVIKNGWVRVPIPSSLLVREAKLDGKPVPLIESGDKFSSKSAVFFHQGRAELLLDVVLPIAINATNESISLPPAAAGITRASIQLSRQGLEVKLAGGFLAEKSESAAKSKWVAYGRENEPLVFSWWKKTEDHRSSQPLRLRGSLTEFVGLGEDVMSIQAEVSAEILQGATKEIRIELPDKVAINQVAGAMVADWEMKPRELVVTLLEPAEKNAKFVFGGETRTPREGQIDIPLLRLLNAERETGGVAVEVLGAGEVMDRKSAGLESADATDLGEVIANRQSPSLLAFRFRSGDSKAARSLKVKVARYTQEAVLVANVEEARYKVLINDEGKSLVQAKYAIRNNQRNFLKVTLPPNAVIWNAAVAGKPIRPGQTSDGSLLLPLEKARAGEDAPAFTAEILYFNRGEEWKNSGKSKLTLPELDLPISRTGVQYYYPPFFKITPDPGAFRTQAYQDPISTAFKGGSATSAGAGSNATGVSPALNNAVADLYKIMGEPISEETPADKAAQALLDRYRARSQQGKREGILPIKMDFLPFGPWIFMVSELTAENQSPAIDISYAAEKKGGSR